MLLRILGGWRCYTWSLENSLIDIRLVLRKSGFLGDEYWQRIRLKSRALIRKINECIHSQPLLEANTGQFVYMSSPR